MAEITWNTPAGDLGTYPESAEMSIQLSANGLRSGSITSAFDPRTTITGNGIINDVTVFMPVTKDRWVINSRNLPGLVRVGQFPNAENPNPIRPQNEDLVWPYRGGRNSSDPTPQPAGGAIGISSVGLVIYGPNTAFQVLGPTGKKMWTLDANQAQVFGEDKYGGHPPPNGEYHYHDTNFINNDAWHDIPQWRDGYRWPDGHSKIVGWAADGYPIYGPYGYRNAMDHTSKIIRMVSGYVAAGVPDPERPGLQQLTVAGTTIKRNVIKTRELPPSIGMRIDGGDWTKGSVWVTDVLPDLSVRLNTSVTVVDRTALVAYYPVGVFVEDWQYVGSQGTTLDRHNGRYCVTPEYPNGTYAYFATEDASGKPQYPYMIGNSFYGRLTPDGEAASADLTVPAERGLVYSLLSGNLPPGVQLQPTGLLYGYPVVTDPGSPAARRYEFSIRARDVISGQVADRSFYIGINDIIMPSITPTTPDLGIYYDSDFVAVQLNAIEYNPDATLTWTVSSGTIPPGLTLDQTGLISGFAESPPPPGPAGSAGYGSGRYDQFVWDFEGKTSSRKYQFSVRLFDGINYAIQNYTMNIYAKSYFRVDNTIITADTEAVNSDRDGYEYPSVVTTADQLPVARQNQRFAFQFKAFYFNVNVPVYWKVNASGVDLSQDITGPSLFDMGAPPTPDDNNQTFPNIPYDNRGFDQSDLSLPPGLGLDNKTGWLSGTLGPTASNKSTYEFDVVAYVTVQISKTEVQIRPSKPVRFKLTVLSDIVNRIIWDTDSDLGYLENGQISDLKVAAHTAIGTTKTSIPLTYSIKSGEYLRIPQGMKLLSTGVLSGRTSFDFFSLDRLGVRIYFDNQTQTYDSSFQFTIIAQNADGTIYSEKLFKMTIKNVNSLPYENLYLKALLPANLRNIFRSIVNDPKLIGDNVLYRPEDPYFGIPNDLKLLVMHGLRADLAENYIAAMSNYHYDKKVNFGTIRKAIATDDYGTPLYEVIYVDVLDYNTNSGVAAPSLANRETGLTVYANSFDNMSQELIAGIGYQNRGGSLPRWMTSVQPDTGAPLGFIRALVLAYAEAGQGDKLLYRYVTSLQSSGYAVTDIMNEFSFTADRYQWDRALTINYDPITQKFADSIETSFDKLPVVDRPDQTLWVTRDSGGLKTLNSVAYQTGVGYLAVGADSTILSSGSGQSWIQQSQVTDLTYVVSPLFPAAVGNTKLSFDYYDGFRVGDEVLQQATFSTNVASFINGIESKLRLSNNFAITVAVGTRLEFIDPLDRSITYANVTHTATSSQPYVYLDNAGVAKIGHGVQVSGIDTINNARYDTGANFTVFLSIPTTNVIATGTTIRFDDLAGNVGYLTTANVTGAGQTDITFTQRLSSINLKGGEYVSIAAITAGTIVRSRVTEMTFTGPLIAGVSSGADISISPRITQDSSAGSVLLHISNTSKIAVGSEIVGQEITSTLTGAAWGSATATTSLLMTVPTANIRGYLFRTMLVIAPGLPASTKVSSISTAGTNTLILLSFPTASSVTAASNITVGLLAPSPLSLGSTVTNKTDTSITISSPLLLDVPVQGDPMLQFGLTVTQLNQVIYAVDRWVAVGTKGLVLDKPQNSSSWHQRYALSYGDLYSIAYAPTPFEISATVGTLSRISGGGGGPPMFGRTVIPLYPSVFDNNLKVGSVISGGDLGYMDNVQVINIFTANSSVQLSSPINVDDGETVTFRTVAGGTYVAAGTSGLIVYSYDGLDSWQAATTPLLTNVFRHVAYHDRKWIAVGDSGKILLSYPGDNAATWSEDTSEVAQEISRAKTNLTYVTYINKWIILGEKGLILIQEDGQDGWTRYSAGVTDTLTGISYYNSTYYLVGSNSLTATSIDATSWTVEKQQVTAVLNSLADGSPVPTAVGTGGTILTQSATNAVDWAVRRIPFDRFNWNTVTKLTILGYPVKNGDTLIFVEQEGQGTLNDGWNLYTSPLDNPDSGELDIESYDSYTIIPGYQENTANPAVNNQRAGVWRVTVDSAGLVTLNFVRPVAINTEIYVRKEVSRLFLDPAIRPGNTVPAYYPLTQQYHSVEQATRFDGKGTRFSSNRDNYVQPGSLDKYLKFTKTGVFR